jgi:elongation factor Ts
MAEITPQLVKSLRDKTGAGMGDCKNALVEAEGDMQTAIEILRKKGAASAAKRADRSAKEGMIYALVNKQSTKGVIVEVNSETDFVARNAKFEEYVKIVADTLLSSNAKTIEELMAEKVGSDTIQGLHNEILAKFSENISVRRFDSIVTENYVTSYIHTGSKLAVLIEASIQNPSEAAAELLHDIAMQVAAMNPLFIDRSQASQEKIQKEIEIYKELAIAEGKKPEMAERIAQGKLEKFFQEQCLVEQTFVKDGNKTIKNVLDEISADFGSEVKILKFVRYFLGEELD